LDRIRFEKEYVSPNPEKSKVFLPAAGGDFLAPPFSSRKKVE
jgi:hypothetical protein